ncbi:hypothetical protein OF83DRAFT_1138026 [Amylostereum chailletii]|nr:hypothetical protein OF83DRAFT_1138026 [Amylostereum chailletii]
METRCPPPSPPRWRPAVKDEPQETFAQTPTVNLAGPLSVHLDDRESSPDGSHECHSDTRTSTRPSKQLSLKHSPSPPLPSIYGFKSDAYTHPSLSNDPDETWSTLPPKRTSKSKPATGVKSSGKFKAPLSLTHPRLVPAAAAIDRQTGQDTTKKVRVTVYHPPPRSSGPTESPQRWTARRGGDPTTARKVREKDRKPGPGSTDGEMANVDLGVIGSRYPAVRAEERKRRHKCGEVRDMLALPSCGPIYHDAWRAVDDEDTETFGNEIGFLRWPPMM